MEAAATPSEPARRHGELRHHLARAVAHGVPHRAQPPRGAHEPQRAAPPYAEVVKSDERGDGVADARCERRADEPEIEDKEERVVEKDIRQSRDEGGEHRKPRLSRRDEEDVEDEPRHRERRRDEERDGVRCAERIERVVRTEHIEQRAQEDEPEDGKSRAEEHGDRDEQREVLPRVQPLARAELRRDKSTAARAEHRRADDRQEERRQDNIDRRQPVRPDRVRDKDAVHDEIDIHKDLRNHHRHGERKQRTVGDRLRKLRQSKFPSP